MAACRHIIEGHVAASRAFASVLALGGVSLFSEDNILLQYMLCQCESTLVQAIETAAAVRAQHGAVLTEARLCNQSSMSEANGAWLCHQQIVVDLYFAKKGSLGFAAQPFEVLTAVQECP